MKTAQALAIWAAVITGFVAVGLFIVWGIRSLNAVATSVTVHTPEPGIHCAVAVTDDGVAIDCWRVDGTLVDSAVDHGVRKPLP